MKNTLQDIEQLQSRFQSCQKIFTALGDENRQRLLCIMLIPLPGHSAGMTGVKIQNGRKYVMIARDAGYCRHSWERLILPGLHGISRKRLSLCVCCRRCRGTQTA